MNRWALRIAAVIMLVMFMLIMVHLQKQLVELQRSRETPVTSTR